VSYNKNKILNGEIMKDEMTKVKLTMHIPFDTPNKNGTMLTKEAVENAVNNIPTNMPIIYRNNKDEYNEKVIGATTSNSHIVIWDSENQVCKITVDGIMFHCNPLITINEIDDKKKDN
jgi:hypothetical protein